MRCENVRLRLDELRTDELSPHEAAAVRGHLAACGACRGAERSLEALAQSAPALLGEHRASCAPALERALFDRWARVRADRLQLWVAFSERGLTEIVPTDERDFDDFSWRHFHRSGKELRRGELPDALAEQLNDAASGRGVERPAVDLGWLPPFERSVLESLTAIPGGELRTYGWVAREAGSPKAVRAVGNACARNPVPLVLPCHRVVPATGGLGGYALGAELKRELLDREGVDFGLVEEVERRRARYVAVDDRWYCFPTCHSLRGCDPSSIEPIRDEREAARRGLEPCDECRPLEAAS